ncbi:C15orf24 protein [Perkinsela sp. CCAP 1560/4]|nr:C15orf24 protein [Perkinsela sp. CCAP 1560/4]|eukprot:KNH09761.1 C15orf24 protein [Perkinsela sp. CCAP 1560/4]
MSVGGYAVLMLILSALDCLVIYQLDFQGKIVLPEGADNLLQNIQVFLYPFHRVVDTNREGFFKFSHVPEGQYRMHIHSEDWHFSPCIVRIGSTAGVKVREENAEMWDRKYEEYYVFRPHARSKAQGTNIYVEFLRKLQSPIIFLPLLGLSIAYLSPFLISEGELKESMEKVKEIVAEFQKNSLN